MCKDTSHRRKIAELGARIALMAALIVITAVGGGGCAGGEPPAPTATAPAAALAHIEVVRSYDASANEHPEGIAVDRDGNVYASLARLGQIRRIAPDGTESTFVDFGEPKPLGLAADSDGNLYCCQHSPGTPNHGVHRIGPDGTSERLPGTEQIVHPNGVALDDKGNVYVSDSEAGTLWRIPPGGPAELWLQHVLLEGTDETPGYPPIGANGVAYWNQGLYVANSEKSHVVRIPIQKRGEAGEPEVVAEGRFGLDGIAVDNYGRIYGALGIQSKVIWIDPASGEITELATRSEGLDIPASLAFGTTEGERESLFVTNYAVSYGSSRPGILKLDVGVPGPPLP